MKYKLQYISIGMNNKYINVAPTQYWVTFIQRKSSGELSINQ